MISPLLILPVVILALAGLAIYEHVTSVTLSLPLTPALTFCTILLPLFAAGNLLCLRHLWPHPRKSSNRRGGVVVNLPKLLLSPLSLQTLQAIFTTVLATLYFTDWVPTNTAVRDCKLATQWQHLFRIKDARSIRTVQDALQCCGFRSVRDMAWPFAASGSGASGDQCAALFDRTLACRGPWAAALRRSAGVNFGVVLAVGVLQIASLMLATRYGAQSSHVAWDGWLHSQQQQQLQEADQGAREAASSRPLLANHDANGSRVQEETDDDEANEEEEEGGGEGGRSNRRQYYGTIENGTATGSAGSNESGPRLEPSRLNSERDVWRDE